MKINNSIEEKNLNLFNEGKNKKDLKDRINLHYSKYLNTTYTVGKYECIHFVSPVNAKIDYLALYSKPYEYNKTSNTAVCFFEDDYKFDGKDDLWDAIYHNDSKIIEQFRERFKDVKYFISPDYSQIGNVPFWLNLFNLQRSRLVSLFLVHELNKLVYPLITYSNEDSFEYVLDGLEECNVVVFSLKGSLKKIEQLDMLKKAIPIVVDKLKKLTSIIVYSVSIYDDKVRELFSSAINKGIEIVIPNNILMERNKISGGILNGEI